MTRKPWSKETGVRKPASGLASCEAATVNRSTVRRWGNEGREMARPLRLEWAGALYHATSRGDRREPIVDDDEDRSAWVAVFG